LAIVQSVVSDHGGRISVESETGVGTSFRIHLPLRAAGRSGVEVIPPPETVSVEAAAAATVEEAVTTEEPAAKTEES